MTKKAPRNIDAPAPVRGGEVDVTVLKEMLATNPDPYSAAIAWGPGAGIPPKQAITIAMRELRKMNDG